MNVLQRKQLELLGRVKRAWYWQQERPRATAACPRPLTILFSQHDGCEQRTRDSFAGMGHTLHFAPLAQADLSRFDLIVPLTLADARYLRNQPDPVRAHTPALPDEDCASLCHDQQRLNNALVSAGFGAHVPAMGPDLAPPFICKPVNDESGADCLLVPDYAAILRLGSAIDQPGRFRQSAVRGTAEHATHFIINNGRIERELTVVHHHDEPLYIKGATLPPPAISVLGRCPDAATLTAMLRAVGYNGIGCAKYKMVNGRLLQLLAIDPCIGGSLMDYFSTFLRSLPQAEPSRRISPSRGSWRDSVFEPSSFGAA